MITDLIKTMTKFSNAISYHQPDLSTNRIVYTSYLDSVIEKFKGQLTCHACVSGQNASCVCAVSHILPSQLLLIFFIKAYNQCLVFFLRFCHSFD